MSSDEDLSERQRLRGTTCPVHADHVLALVGEAPGPRTRSDLPFYPYPPNSAAGRLLKYLGWSRRRYLLTFARMNLLAEYPGARFPIAEGRRCVPKIVAALHPRPMLLMGKGVAAAFDVGGLQPLTWRRVPLPHEDGHDVSVKLAVVPHTSGRNLWYNDPAHQAEVRDFINSAEEEARVRA